MSGLLRTTVARQVAEAWRDGMVVERSPEGHQQQLVDRLMGALGELGIDEALVSEEHYATFSQVDGWGLQHPVMCRPDLAACVIHRRMVAEQDEPMPAEGAGCYRVRIVGDGSMEFVSVKGSG